eukprot:scaffold434_cov186-Pinguiococcus_pyrenoidosus.AAC.50
MAERLPKMMSFARGCVDVACLLLSGMPDGVSAIKESRGSEARRVWCGSALRLATKQRGKGPKSCSVFGLRFPVPVQAFREREELQETQEERRRGSERSRERFACVSRGVSWRRHAARAKSFPRRSSANPAPDEFRSSAKSLDQLVRQVGVL